MVTTEPTDHQAFLSEVTRRLRRSYATSLAQDVGVSAAAVVATAAIAGWLWAAAIPVLLATMGVAVCAAIGFVAWKLITLKPAPNVVARLADQRCASNDIFSTTLIEGESPFSQSVIAQADRVAVAHQPSDVVRPHIFWWKLLLVFVGFAIASTVLFVDGPGSKARAIARRDKATIERAKENVRRSAEQIKVSGVDPLLAAQLDQLAKTLDRTSDPLEAARLLQQAALAAQPPDSAQALARRAAVKGLERGLAGNPLAPGESAAEQFRKTAEDLDPLTTDLEALKKRLEELSKSQQSGSPETAKALKDAADALAASDLDAAKQALNDAADAQEAEAAKASTDEVRSEEASKLKTEASSLQQPPTGITMPPGVTLPPGVSLAPGKTLPPGVSLVPGSLVPGTITTGASTLYVQVTGTIPPGVSTIQIATPPGSGQPPGTQPPGGQPGAVQPGAVQPGAGQPGAGGNGPSGGASGGSAAGKGANPSVGAPTGTLAPTKGKVYAPGVVTGGGAGDVVGAGATPSPSGSARVPIKDVASKSKARADKAIESSDLDPSEQDVVKDYFDSLNAPPPPVSTPVSTKGK